MRLFARLRSTFRELTDADNTQLPRWQRAMLYGIDLTRFAANKLKQDRAPQMAAALTYHTLFSLLPTLVLTLVVAQAFVSQEQLQDLKAQTVAWAVRWLDSGFEQVEERAPVTADNPAGQPPIVPSTSADHDGSPTSATGFGRFTAAARHAAAQAGTHAKEQAHQQAEQRANADRAAEYARTAGKLDEQLTLWLDQLQNVDFRSIGLVGILIFIYGATKLLATIESSFNLVLRAEENRSWFIRLPLYYTTITLAPVVLLAGQWAQRQFVSLLDTGYAVTTWIAGPFIVLSPLLTAWLVLLLAYRLLPNAKLKMRPAAAGSFVAAVGLGVAVQAFALYVDKTGSTSLYGALALLPLFLLLLWIVWQIVLYGLELASVLQFMPNRETRRKQQQADAGPKLVDPRLIIPALVLFAQRFREGRPLEPETLGNELQLPAGATDPILAALVKHGYIHRVEEEDTCYALAKAPETIELSALLVAARQLGRADIESVNTSLASLDDAERRGSEARTLASLM